MGSHVNVGWDLGELDAVERAKRAYYRMNSFDREINDLTEPPFESGNGCKGVGSKYEIPMSGNLHGIVDSKIPEMKLLFYFSIKRLDYESLIIHFSHGISHTCSSYFFCIRSKYPSIFHLYESDESIIRKIPFDQVRRFGRGSCNETTYLHLLA